MNSTALRLLYIHVKRCVWISAAVGMVLLQPLTGSAEGPVPFRASFQGTFTLQFATGPDGTNELFFAGDGLATHLGWSTVDGYSTTRTTTPDCMEIVTDAVILTAAKRWQALSPIHPA